MSNGSKNISTNTTTLIGGPGTVVSRVIVNTAGNASYVSLYDVKPVDATGTPSYGFVCKIPTAAVGNSQIDHKFSLGACAVTAGTGAADISVLYNI